MKIAIAIICGLIIAGAVFAYFKLPISNLNETPPSSPSINNLNSAQVTVIAEGLDTPWAIAFLPDGNLLVTERNGNLKKVDVKSSSKVETIAKIDEVLQIGEGGLLGVTLHPDFNNNNYLYLYYTYSGSEDNTLNRVSRFTFSDKKLIDEKIIIDQIPGASNHNGGRIKFGPDNMLYITTGDASEPSLAQDKNSLAGKILRVTDDGAKVYSYGHRNPQGLAWDDQGNLWAAEHGSSTKDELNKIEEGKNYGWPTIQGTEQISGMETPIINSGSDTWAPSGLAFKDGKFYFSALRGVSLFSFDPSTKELKRYLKNEYGRLREAIVGPDGNLYITTSNKDGRGNPAESDDRILKINLEAL